MGKIIDEFKSIVKDIVRNRDIINANTKVKQSGIYMIYIEGFDSESILPIYIGKSKDMQKRYKEHYC